MLECEKLHDVRLLCNEAPAKRIVEMTNATGLECEMMSFQGREAAGLNPHNAVRGLLGKFRVFGMMLSIPLTVVSHTIEGIVHCVPTFRINHFAEMESCSGGTLKKWEDICYSCGRGRIHEMMTKKFAPQS